MAPDVLARMSPDDPWQVLHRAIVLSYADNAAAGKDKSRHLHPRDGK
jgi:hypothetical protein